MKRLICSATFFLSILIISSCKKKATCTDGVQNGTETAVDCGGSCTPCSTPTPPSSGGNNSNNSAMNATYSNTKLNTGGGENSCVVVIAGTNASKTIDITGNGFNFHLTGVYNGTQIDLNPCTSCVNSDDVISGGFFKIVNGKLVGEIPLDNGTPSGWVYDVYQI